jgi:uncharacterized membrane protein (DUF4010 family)
VTAELASATRVAVATLGGAAIGVERQWSGHASGSRARFGGVRTFTLLGLAAGIAGELWTIGYGGLATVILAGAAALVVTSYAAASRREIDATTEVAAMVVLAAGALAGAGHLTVASGGIAITAFLLVEKSRLHSFVRRLDDAEVRAGVRFAVMATVILPLLPVGPFGPLGGVRPREIWAFVLLLSGLSFAGYVARRALGPGQGYALAGLLGGLVSSTSVTMGFARESRSTPTAAPGLALGAVAASTMMFARLALVVTALNPGLGLELSRLLVTPLVGGIALTALGLIRRPRRAATLSDPPGNPLQVLAALQMAILFQVMLFAVHAARQAWGDSGMIWSGALVGLTDADALAFSIAKSEPSSTGWALGAVAVAVGALSNTLFKLVLAVALGGSGFRWRAGLALAALAILSAAAIAVVTLPR